MGEVDLQRVVNHFQAHPYPFGDAEKAFALPSEVATSGV